MSTYHVSLLDMNGLPRQQATESLPTLADAIEQAAEWLDEDPETMLWSKLGRIGLVSYHTDAIRVHIIIEE